MNYICLYSIIKMGTFFYIYQQYQRELVNRSQMEVKQL
jgi:hypothetical protein